MSESQVRERPIKRYPTEIDASIPRAAYLEPIARQPGPCPRCRGVLRQASATYVVLTRRPDRAADPIIMGNDAGWFCDACPTVVINTTKVDEMLGLSRPGWDVGTEFTVPGLVDYHALPPEQQHLPLTEWDPFPLVEFTEITFRGRPSGLPMNEGRRVALAHQRAKKRAKKRK